MTEVYENKNLIVICEHCQTKVSGAARFCGYCDTAPKRQAIDFENNTLWLEKFGKEYICRFHLREKLEKERQLLLK